MAGKAVVEPAAAVGASPEGDKPEASKPKEPVKVYTFVCASEHEPAIVPGQFGKDLLWPGIEFTTADFYVAEKLRVDPRLKEKK